MAGAAAGQWDSLRVDEVTETPEEKFALLVGRQSQFVFRVAYAVLRNAEDAEDVVQDTFLKLFKSGTWTTIENERAFLARTAWRVAISKKPGRQTASESALDGIACEDINPEEAALGTEWTRTIHRLIDALPERLRRPLALSSIEGITTPEIAIVMDLPESSVRRQIAEARSLLKEKLNRVTRRHE